MTPLNPSGKDIIDVINQNDEVIKLRTRDEVHKLGLLHREVHVWLFDKNKNIYFSKSARRKSSAGLLDASIGGHVDTGENYTKAAIRETKEESEISINIKDLIFLEKFTASSKNKKRGTINNFMRSIYIYKKPVTSKDIKRDPGENDGFQKFSIKSLENLGKNKKLFHKFIITHELPHVLHYLKEAKLP